MSSASQRKEMQKWALEIPKLDNSRKLKGIYFIDPKDEEFMETVKNERKKLEIRMEAAMPCKIRKNRHRKTCSPSDIRKTKMACIVEADESTRKRLEGTLPEHHEHHSAGKGSNSLNHYNLVHKFISVPHEMKIPDVRAPVEKEWEKTRENTGVATDEKVRNKKEVIDEARKEGKQFSSLH